VLQWALQSRRGSCVGCAPCAFPICGRSAPVTLVAVLSVLLVGGAATPAALAGQPIQARSASALALGPVRAPARARAAAQPWPDRPPPRLASLQRSGTITPADLPEDYAAYVAAVNSLKKAERHAA